VAPPVRKRSRAQDAELRRLNAELGIGSGTAWRGLLLGALLIVVLLLPVALLMGPRKEVTGVVTEVSLGPGRRGTGGPFANVRVDGGDAAVALHPASLCRAGDKIDLLRRRGIGGYHYELGYRGCTRRG
jgi:hypothetical protein